MPDADVRVGGRYRLGRHLAAGGMGSVWEGWDERLHRTVAIKRLHLQPWISDEERQVGVQRAMREARLTARLHHPHVVQVYDIVDDADAPCLIMEYVPSRSLHDVVRERGPLPPAEVARIGGQIAAGLSAAHAAGIVHRDVKAGNVLITEDGSAKVSDFGISHAFDDVTVTSTGLLVGTPAYLAPEVARGAAPSFASDVYSLAATLYLAVEGRLPFGNDANPMAVLHRVATGQWDPPQRAGELTGLLSRMMALDPADRPSMQDVLAELSGVRQHEPPAPNGVTTQVLAVKPAPPRDARPNAEQPALPRTRRRFGLLQIATCVLGLALVAVLAIVLATGGESDQSSGQPGAPTATGSASGSGSDTGGNSGSGENSGSGGNSGSAPDTSGSGAPTAQQLADAVTDYFRVVPSDLRTGWNLLTDRFQNGRAQNYGTYRSYWNSVDRVEVTGVEGSPPNMATADLVYYYKDGQVVEAHTTFLFVRQDGVLKIDAES